MELSLPEGCSKLLLHSCCAPCSGAIIECLISNGIRPGLFFSNSNILDREEYNLRRNELLRYAALFNLEMIDDNYDHRTWLEKVKGLECEPERGRRCGECFLFRLERAASYAAANGYDVLTTTLASSRWKSLEQVGAAGRKACEGLPVIFWDMNWRKGGLQPRRDEIIHEQSFYNQTFCGCEFSRH